VELAAAKLERTVGEWGGALRHGTGDSAAGMVRLADAGLDELAESGATQKAIAEAPRAGVHGRNAIWAATKGAWQSGTPAVRAAIVTAVAAAFLLLLVSPVLCIVFLVSLLIAAAAQRAGSAKAKTKTKAKAKAEAEVKA
jgi:hypothetical protein